MTDDIVTRLRGSWDCSCLYIKEHGLDRKCLDCEAADEIERLRNERNTLLLHLQCVSLYRGTNTANAVLDYYKPADNNLDWSTITINTEQDT